MKECKFKLNREQLSTLVHIFKRVKYWSVNGEVETIEQALVFSIFEKLAEKLEVKLIKLYKHKLTITFNKTESLAILMYFNWAMFEVDTQSYHGILMISIRDQIAQIFPFQ